MGGSAGTAELLAMGSLTSTNRDLTIDCSAFSGDITIFLGGRMSNAIWYGNLDSKTVTKQYGSTNDTSTCSISSSKVVSTADMVGTTSKYQHGTFIFAGHVTLPN